MSARHRWARACRRLTLALGLVTIATAPILAQARGGMHPGAEAMDLDRKIRVFGLADLLEYVPNGTGAVRVDGLGWIGGDYNRLFLRLDGEQPFRGSDGQMALDVAYGRLISPFWTALLGGRLETRGLGGSSARSRGLLAVGLEGLAPYWFEMEPMLYVSDKGQVSGQFTTSLDLLFTQRLILQPRLETSFAVQAVRDLGIGSGINDVELGARMRYEFRRELAPYMGLSWTRKMGGTAALARNAGERVSEAGLVFGARVWR